MSKYTFDFIISFQSPSDLLECKFFVHERCQTSVPPSCEKFDQPEPAPPLNPIDSARPSFKLPKSLRPLSSEGLKDLPKFSDFEYIGHLGDGGYSHVYCVRHILSMEYMAIKVVDGKNPEARDHFEMERQILFRYSEYSPFMIKGYCSFHQGVSESS